ncbi:polysaccharide pyruvyl transferase family protein [Ruegeria arenilitoris]|uniref:polysaccharide pyruvyl transferase family protein n=1 Tax=Ruegeria arenilitoris TaxID=1173585 RepID=UPI0014798880
MKVGVLSFSYHGSPLFQKEYDRFGSFNVNLGDNVQSLAVRYALNRLGITQDRIVSIDRDTLPSYNGHPVAVILNGCFKSRCFPIPNNVSPIFLGFEAKAPVIAEFAEHLRTFGPIGCRDPATARACRENGIEAYVSGCFSLSLPRRKELPENPLTYIVFGDGAGALPVQMLCDAPKELLVGARMVYQRMPLHTWPLETQDLKNAERTTEALLEAYRQNAGLVITPLHHAAAPCLAMGIPVLILRRGTSSRFGFLETLTKIYYENKPEPLGWDVRPVDLSNVREKQENLLRNELQIKGLI